MSLEQCCGTLNVEKEEEEKTKQEEGVHTRGARTEART